MTVNKWFYIYSLLIVVLVAHPVDRVLNCPAGQHTQVLILERTSVLLVRAHAVYHHANHLDAVFPN